MSKQKGGRKLRRTALKKGYYAAQFNVTARNKARRAARIARRKQEIPHHDQEAKRVS